MSEPVWWDVWEAAIVARLQAKMPSGTTVLTLADYVEMPENKQKFPLVAVIYDGFTPAEENGINGRIALLVHEFLVVCGARSAARKGDPIDAKRQVGALTFAAARALCGFSVGRGQTLHLAPAPGPEYDGGDAYAPLVFNVRATMIGGD